MNKKDDLGDRMKWNYENRSKIFLLCRVPVIIRIDGKAFHTFTRGMNKPYDTLLMDTMQKTMLNLCKSIQGCKFGYTQSDEITLLLTDYDTLTTQAWFNYELQKMCSVSSSMATAFFNEFFLDKVYENEGVLKDDFDHNIYKTKVYKAMFDSRCFNLPKGEVCNCFIWRQQDATRNAIQLLGRNSFSHKELNEKSCNDIQDMLMLEKGINFNDEPISFKRGSCCYKDANHTWIIDKETPVFTQDRNFIEKFIFIDN